MVNLSRRSILFGLVAAPIVVRQGLIMPVKALILSPDPGVRFYKVVAVGLSENDYSVDYAAVDDPESQFQVSCAPWKARGYKLGDIVAVEPFGIIRP